MTATTAARVGDMPTVPPCEYGATGYCLNGRHGDCQCSIGGPSEFGIRSPSGYVTDRSGSAVTVAGRPVEIGPWHVWRCSCDCHTSSKPPAFAPTSKWMQHLLVAAPKQLALFGDPT